MEDYKYIAHRGLFHNDQGIPENSLIAFQKAIDAGLPIELDVRLTKDRQMVVFHDASCKRMAGEPIKVSELPYRELKKLRLLGTDQYIPLFSEVLKLVRGQVPLLIEVKNERWIGCLERKLKRMLSDYRGAYMIESFHPMVVAWVKRHMRGVEVGQLVSQNSTSLNPLEKLVMQQRGFYKLTRPDFLAYDIRELTPAMSLQFHRRHMKVYGWTVRSDKDYKKIRSLCDGVIFDTVAPEKII